MKGKYKSWQGGFYYWSHWEQSELLQHTYNIILKYCNQVGYNGLLFKYKMSLEISGDSGGLQILWEFIWMMLTSYTHSSSKKHLQFYYFQMARRTLFLAKNVVTRVFPTSTRWYGGRQLPDEKRHNSRPGLTIADEMGLFPNLGTLIWWPTIARRK